jgi:two-component system chemotaxis response regulator CheB
MIKILIVDDSALMRKYLVQIFEQEGGFEIRTARNGLEALQEAKSFRPDVVTLDINMPDMDGITALSHIMVEQPCPVVMVSSLTEKGALATFEALALGAVDYICKPGGTISLNIDQIRGDIVAKVRTACGARVKQTRGLAGRIREQNRQASIGKKPVSTFSARAKTGVVVIGVSTGGPRTLEDILPELPANFPWPVVVAQHMPEHFTAPFASRMNQMCQLKVVEVNRPMAVEVGTIYIGRGSADMMFSRRGTGISLVAVPENKQYLWHPSVEFLVRSALDQYPAESIIGVLLTGMGYDGAEAMAEVYRRGGRTIAESEKTAVVFGMPAELIQRKGATVVAPSTEIAKRLIAWLQ